MKRKTYLWGIGILVVASAIMLLNLEENLEEEFTYIAEQMESTGEIPQVSYLDLPLTEEDKRNIFHLLEPLANWSLIRLGLNRKDIEARGYATKNIPVLRYLAYLRKEPELLQFVFKIRKRSKIWTPFQQGFIKGLSSANHQGEIQPYLPSLSQDLDLNLQTLASFVDAGDWSDFLHTLLFSK